MNLTAATDTGPTIDLGDEPAESAGAGADLRRRVPQPAALATVDREVALEERALALALEDGVLVVAVADTGDEELAARLAAHSGHEVSLVAAEPDQLARALHLAHPPVARLEQVIAARHDPEDPDDGGVAGAVLALLLEQAVRDRASDIHLEPRAQGMDVRIRVDGRLRHVAQLPEAVVDPLVSSIKVAADCNILEHRRYQDGHLGVEVDGTELDLRVSVAPTTAGEKVVLRLLGRDWARRDLGQLGMGAAERASVEQTLASPYGMLLCVGPTGAGKTTTLYAAMDQVADEQVNVVTIEDPVEYSLPEINQTQVDEAAGVGFGAGLRGLLRQDPDVILVGEVRDPETAEVAVQAALSGHLVLTSYHATDATGALFRLMESGMDPATVVSAVRGVIAQRLVRRLCTACTQHHPPTEQQVRQLARLAPAVPAPELLADAAGCSLCAHTGFDGQVGVFELLEVDEDLHELLSSGVPASRLRAAVVERGMVPLGEAAARLVAAGTTSLGEALRQVGTAPAPATTAVASDRCRGMTRQDRRCRNQASDGPYCRTHRPAEPVDDDPQG